MVEARSDSLKRATCMYRSRRAAAATAAVTGITADVSKTGLLYDRCIVSVFGWVSVPRSGYLLGRLTVLTLQRGGI